MPDERATKQRGNFMVRRRAWVAAAMALPLALTGITAATVAPAGATPGNTTVTCELVPEILPDQAAGINCVIADPDGIRSVGTKFSEFGQSVDRLGAGFFDCANDRTTTFGSNFTPRTTARFSVTDCENPRSHAYFVVRPNGTVHEIKQF